MTNSEFSREFDIAYHSIASNAAPGLNAYEKSVLLTEAQEMMIRAEYDPAFNAEGVGYQGSENKRREFAELTKKAVSLNSFTSATNSIAISNSRFFPIEDDVMFITQERLRISSSDTCLNGKYIRVKPQTDDKYNRDLDNPFKNPDDSVAWRTDYRTINGSRVVEIIHGATYTPVEYHYRYIKYPSPIILEDLASLGVTINGISDATSCELDDTYHREILNRAVAKALMNTGDPRYSLTAK